MHHAVHRLQCPVSGVRLPFRDRTPLLERHCRTYAPSLSASGSSPQVEAPVIAWAIGRRTLIDLLGTIQDLNTCGVALYVDQRNIAPWRGELSDILSAWREFQCSGGSS